MTAVQLGPEARAAARTSLAPVREALLARAKDEAARTRADAARDVAAQVAAAEQEVAGLVEEGKAQGRQDAQDLLAVEQTRSRRAARSLVLAAQLEAYEALRRACQVAVAGLLAGPEYTVLREQLMAEAQAALGAQAEIDDDPSGGLVARVPGRLVDLSRDVLVERAMASLGTQVEELWAP